MSRFQYYPRTAFTRPRVVDTKNNATAEFASDDHAATAAEALQENPAVATFLHWTVDKEATRG